MSMDLKKVLYISQEIAPYLKSTEMSEQGRMLPQNIQEKGYEVRTFMPRYGCINERRNQLHEVIRLSGLNIPIDDSDHPLIIKVATLLPTRMQVYFIDNDDYFQRHSAEGLETEITPEDNDERTMFFIRGVAETVKKLGWVPEIIHCTGWVSALAPAYLKTVYSEEPAFHGTKIVYSLFGNGFEGTLDPRMAEKLKLDGLPQEVLDKIGDKPVDYLTLCKLGIDFADALVLATDHVDKELVEYAKASGKPLLDYPGNEEGYLDKYDEFYRSL